MEIHTFEMTSDTLTFQYNNAKEQTCFALIKAGYLTEQQAKEFMENYAFIVKPKGFFGEILDKLLKRDNERQAKITLVKIVN